MIPIIAIMVLWTWGLTPWWVNTLSTILLIVKAACEVLEER